MLSIELPIVIDRPYDMYPNESPLLKKVEYGEHKNIMETFKKLEEPKKQKISTN